MKPMKDLFLLPVDSLGYEGYQALVAHEFDHVSTNQAALHAAHAVNNVDALADALESVLSTSRGTSGRIIIEVEDEQKLVAALKDYRGEA